MSDTPETQEAVERWRQGKINIFDEMARLEWERDEARKELQQWRDAAKGAENPHPDEVHCTCVPLLRGSLELTRKERDEWKAKFIQANKDYGFELRDPCGTIWDHAKKLQQKHDQARAALQRISDCDWVITLPDRMDAVRKIARDALEAAK